MRYYLLYFVFYITKPVRYLMPFYNDFDFATFLVFPNPYARWMVESIARVETENFTNIKSRLYHNYWSMGAAVGKNYQNGTTKIGAGGLLEPREFATYRDAFQSVYDFRAYLKYRTNGKPKRFFEALFWGNLLPKGKFQTYSPLEWSGFFPTTASMVPDAVQLRYLNYVAGTMVLAGYHKTDAGDYYQALLDKYSDFKIRLLPFIFNIVGTVLTVILLYRLYIYIKSKKYRTKKGKNKIEQPKKQFSLIGSTKALLS